MRHRIAKALYFLALAAMLFMMVGCGITLWRDVQHDGFVVTWVEHVLTPGSALAIALWMLPSFVLYVIGAAIDKNPDSLQEVSTFPRKYPRFTKEQSERLNRTLRKLKEDGWIKEDEK